MKKLLIAGAAGAMIFGLTAASASTLNLENGAGWFSHTVQQSDIVQVDCAVNKLEVGMVIADNKVGTVKLLQQYLEGCVDTEVQVAAYKGADTKPYAVTNFARIAAKGSDTVLTFNPPLDAQMVTRVRVTIADQILAIDLAK